MQEKVAEVLSYGLAVWRYKWLALGLAWIVALVGWAYVWKLPESYVGTARVYVDTNSILAPLLRGLAITPNTDQRISMLSQTLLSRPNLQKLARMTDLDLTATSQADEESLIRRLEDSIELSGSRRNSSLYTISVTDPDRETARRVTQALITVFIESSLSDKRQDSSDAQSFLQQQLVESEQRLIEAENRLAVFKQRNVDVLPGELGDYYSRLELARNELKQAELQLREVENRRAELERQIAGQIPETVRLPIDDRIQALYVQIDGLLTRYTDRHPEVVRLQGLIAELETQRNAEVQRLRSEGGRGTSALDDSPIYQEMRNMLSYTEGEAAELQVRVAEYRDRVEDLAGKVDQIPTIEAELKQLDRDYGVLVQQHQHMLQRRESARLSDDMESGVGKATFRVIDPPFVPLKPSEPNKLVLNAGVLLGAIGAGVGAALLLVLVHPIVTDARKLAQVTGFPLLGTVSWNKTEAEKTVDRWRLAGFSACATMFLLTFAGVMLAPGILA